MKTDQQVVVLVDEYDKPILETLENRQQAEANRDYLRGFYGMIKGCARYIRFVFVTGISMYSKVSLFSNLNNLNDISLSPPPPPPAMPPFVAIPMKTSGAYSPLNGRNYSNRSARKYGVGIMAITGWVKRKSTIRSTSCCIFKAASSNLTGIRPARLPSCISA